MTDDATKLEKLKRQANHKREAARAALVDGDSVRAAILHGEAVALEDAAKELVAHGER